MKSFQRGWRLGSLWRLAAAGLLAAAQAVSVAPPAGAAAPDPAPLAPAETIGVTNFDDPFPAGCNPGVNCSLREAIFRANLGIAADTILLPAGTYTITRSGSDNTDVSGDLDIFNDLNIVVQPGPGGITATIRADAAVGDRIFHVLGAGTAVTMTNLVIQEGTSITDTDGGGLLVGIGASLRLISVTVQNNLAIGVGGGIANLGELRLVDSLVRNNLVQQFTAAVSGPAGGALAPGGGGIFAGNNAVVVLQHSDVINNHASVNRGGGGVGLAPGASLTVTDGLISRNGSAAGAGVAGFSARVYMADTTVYSNTAGPLGGGIYIDGELTLVDSLVQENVARPLSQALNEPSQPSAGSIPTGGGIYGAPGAVVVLQNTEVIGNQVQNVFASGGGMAMVATSQLTVTGGLISGNHAAFSGGGVFGSDATMVISNAVIYSNTANTGGGLNLAGGSALLEGVQVVGNQAAHAAGMQLDASLVLSGTASFTLAASVVASNTASAEGGGIGSGGSLTVTNSTLSGNSAGTGGGLVASHFLSLDHVTISGNNAGDTGGVVLSGTTGVVRNTIIAGNVDTAGAATPDCGGTIQSGDYNLIGNDTGCAFIGPTTHTPRNVAALLGPLQNNGGTTVGAQLTHALLSGSPAREAADPTNCPATDQRGVPRAPGGPCDIGAFEADVEFQLFLPLVLR